MAMNLPSAKARGRRTPMADINVTPLVDVMLVLLIIFMVTAPLMTSGVKVNLPDSRAKALDTDKKPVDIAIDKAGAITIDDQPVTIDAMATRLAPIAERKDAEGKPPQVILRAERTLDYGTVMKVMGELNRAGLNRVSLLSNAKGDE